MLCNLCSLMFHKYLYLRETGLFNSLADLRDMNVIADVGKTCKGLKYVSS